MGRLSQNLEDLRQALANTDEARKRWLADTSHELRTPLAIARGEVEAMLDGIHAINSQNLQTILTEILHLQKLIEDLGELASSDIGSLRYRKQALDFTQLCRDSLSQHHRLLKSQNLKISSDLTPTCPLWGDPVRLAQLLNNLLTNSIKYTDAGGQIALRLVRTSDSVILTLEDSAPTVTDQQMPYLFDHLYRVESSRNRDTGGSGLGLAIARRIAEAHKGSLVADHSPLGGIKMTLNLPVSELVKD